MTQDEDEPLRAWGSGDAVSGARRRGDVVVKPGGPWAASVAALLDHLAERGYRGAPRPVAPWGRESDFVVEYVDGTSAHPGAWKDDDVHQVGVVLRGLHDATDDFALPASATWKNYWLRSLGEGERVYGHGDPAPWNIVGRDSRPEVLIDWEYAGPIDRLTEVAYGAWLNAQLHDDDVAELQGLPDAASRARQFAMIIDGYRWPRDRQGEVVERMIDIAVHAAREEAVAARVTPESDQAIDSDGYPVLWAVTWRSRSASWMIRHRKALNTVRVD